MFKKKQNLCKIISKYPKQNTVHIFKKQTRHLKANQYQVEPTRNIMHVCNSYNKHIIECLFRLLYKKECSAKNISSSQLSQRPAGREMNQHPGNRNIKQNITKSFENIKYY